MPTVVKRIHTLTLNALSKIIGEESFTLKQIETTKELYCTTINILGECFQYTEDNLLRLLFERCTMIENRIMEYNPETSELEPYRTALNILLDVLSSQNMQHILNCIENSTSYHELELNDNQQYQGYLDQILCPRHKVNVLFHKTPIVLIKSKLQNDCKSFNTFGVFDSYRDCEQIENVIFGDSDKLSINVGVFDAIVLHAECSKSFRAISDDFLPKQELEILSKRFKYLRVGGMLNIVLPIFRLSESFCSFVAKRATDIKINRINTLFVEVYAVKKCLSDFTMDHEGYKLLRLYSKNVFTSLAYTTLVPYHYTNRPAKITEFKCHVLSEALVKRVCKRSNAYVEFYKQLDEPIKDNCGEPLIHFNTGQLGIIMSSGRASGPIVEENGAIHYVNSKISKSNVEKDSTTTIVANKVNIHILASNGDHFSID